MATAFFEKPAVVWGNWPEGSRSQRNEIEENKRAAEVFARALTYDTDEEGSTHTLLDSDLEDPYAVSDTDEPNIGWKGPYPTMAQDYEYEQMRQDNAEITAKYHERLLDGLRKRPFAELKAVDEYDKRSISSYQLGDLLFGVDAMLGPTVPDLSRSDWLAREGDISKEDSDYVLHAWDFPGMEGYSLFELDRWYVSAQSLNRRDGQYYGTPIGGRKQVRLGCKFPIHHIHPAHREEVNSIVVNCEK